jgi:quinol monooxygenase YgiN
VAVLIIAGSLYVPPEERDRWVRAHYDIVKLARSQPGCVDLAISADPVEEGRVNLFEQWESEEHLELWRALAEPPPKPEILSASVQKHHVSSSESPF